VTLEEIGQWLTTNPWAIIVLTISTVGSLVLGAWGLFVTIRGVRVRQPCFATRSNNLVRGLASQIPDVVISFRGFGGVVENLTSTKVLFFNWGREAIRRGDIVKDHPITIRVKNEALVLGVALLYSKEANHFTVTRSADRSHATITFEFLDHLDGAVIEIIHTGVCNDDVTVEGLVINAGTPMKLGVGTDPLLVSLTSVFWGLGAVSSMILIGAQTKTQAVTIICSVLLVFSVGFLSWRVRRNLTRIVPHRPSGSFEPFFTFWS